MTASDACSNPIVEALVELDARLDAIDQAFSRLDRWYDEYVPEASDESVQSTGIWTDEHTRAVEDTSKTIRDLGTEQAFKVAVWVAGLPAIGHEVNNEFADPHGESAVQKVRRLIQSRIRLLPGEFADGPEEPVKKNTKRATVDMRMTDAARKNPDAVGWSARKWARFLGCSVSTVHGTNTWKVLMNIRRDNKAKRMTDRHRKPKGSDLRRD